MITINSSSTSSRRVRGAEAALHSPKKVVAQSHWKNLLHSTVYVNIKALIRARIQQARTIIQLQKMVLPNSFYFFAKTAHRMSSSVL
jgi:hypothetical protein